MSKRGYARRTRYGVAGYLHPGTRCEQAVCDDLCAVGDIGQIRVVVSDCLDFNVLAGNKIVVRIDLVGAEQIIEMLLCPDVVYRDGMYFVRVVIGNGGLTFQSLQIKVPLRFAGLSRDDQARCGAVLCFSVNRHCQRFRVVHFDRGLVYGAALQGLVQRRPSIITDDGIVICKGFQRVLIVPLRQKIPEIPILIGVAVAPAAFLPVKYILNLRGIQVIAYDISAPGAYGLVNGAKGEHQAQQAVWSKAVRAVDYKIIHAGFRILGISKSFVVKPQIILALSHGQMVLGGDKDFLRIVVISTRALAASAVFR